MLRLTAELADRWNGGLRSIDEVPPQLAALDTACRRVGRTRSITKSVEVLVRTVPSSTAPEPREIRGDHGAIAGELRRFGDLGIDHLQVQLRPNSLAGVEAFAPVIERMRRS